MFFITFKKQECNIKKKPLPISGSGMLVVINKLIKALPSENVRYQKWEYFETLSVSFE